MKTVLNTISSSAQSIISPARNIVGSLAQGVISVASSVAGSLAQGINSMARNPITTTLTVIAFVGNSLGRPVMAASIPYRDSDNNPFLAETEEDNTITILIMLGGTLGIILLSQLPWRRSARAVRRTIRSPVMQSIALGTVGTTAIITPIIYFIPSDPQNNYTSRLTPYMTSIVIGGLVPALATMFRGRQSRSFLNRFFLSMIPIVLTNRFTLGSRVDPVFGSIATLIFGVYCAVSMGTGFRRSMVAGSLASLVGLTSLSTLRTQSVPPNDYIISSLVFTTIGTLSGSFIGRLSMKLIYNRRNNIDPVTLANIGFWLSSILGPAVGGGALNYLGILPFRERIPEHIIMGLATIGGSVMGSGSYFTFAGRLTGGRETLPIQLTFDSSIVHPRRRTISVNNIYRIQLAHNIDYDFRARRDLTRYTRHDSIYLGTYREYSTRLDLGNNNDSYTDIISRITKGTGIYTDCNLLTFVSSNEYEDTARDYGINVNDVFRNPDGGQDVNVVALHGVGNYVFVNVQQNHSNDVKVRFMTAEDFADYLLYLSQRKPFRFLAEKPIKLLVCFAAQSETPLSWLFPNSLAQLVADKLNVTVYAGPTVIFPDTNHFDQTFLTFEPN